MAGKNEVTLSSNVNLGKALDAFKGMNTQLKKVGQASKEVSDQISKNTEENTKKTERYLSQVANFARRAADQIKDDFKALVSLNAVKDSLKLSEQFRGTVKEAFNLHDTIQKLGRTFGIAGGDFNKFQADMMRGLGDIGIGSDAAVKTLEGLAETPVRGRAALIEYSKAAGELSSISNTKGSEGEIAAGIARVLEARGVNPNDVGAMKGVAEDLRRVFNQTGKGPKETVNTMQEIFANMSKDMRQKVSTRGLANLAAVAQVSGPNSTKFLEEFLGKSPIARKAMEAQGFKGIIGDKGLDIEKFKEASQAILSRVGGDPRMAAQTLGLSEEAAEGFVRLTERLDEAKKAQDSINNATGDLTEQYMKNRTAMESFQGAISRVKGMFAGPLSKATDMVTHGLQKLSSSDKGALATVAGGGLLAALLAGGGLRGIGKHVMGMGKEKLEETISGKEVIPVRVVNADEIGGGVESHMSGGKLGEVIAKGVAVGAAAYAGYKAGELINDKIIEPYTQGTTEEGFQGNAVERLFFKIDKMIGGKTSGEFMKNQKVIVELNTRDLKATTQPTRGASQ